MRNHDFDHGILDQVAHRPWPMPGGPWLMTQTWHDLLFAHWPVDVSVLRPLVPNALPLDYFDGVPWVGIVPFHMSNVAPRGVPSLPYLSRMPELNVRTYVRVDDKPGVYFFSLDAARGIAARTARLLLNLPYHTASMHVWRSDTGVVTYRSDREGAPPASFSAIYQAAGSPSPAAPGTLEYFLTERYCLYHQDRDGAPYRLEIHHPPWPLQPAEADISRNTMAAAAGIALPATAPLLHFAARQDVVAWRPDTLG